MRSSTTFLSFLIVLCTGGMGTAYVLNGPAKPLHAFLRPRAGPRSCKILSLKASDGGNLSAQERFMQQWKAKQAAQAAGSSSGTEKQSVATVKEQSERRVSSKVSGWRSRFVDSPSHLLMVEDFLDQAESIVRTAGGCLTLEEFGKRFLKLHEEFRVYKPVLDENAENKPVIDWFVPVRGRVGAIPQPFYDSEGSIVLMGEILESSRRFELRKDKAGDSQIIALTAATGQKEKRQKAGGAAEAVDVNLEGVSGKEGAFQSVLDYAVDEVLTTHGYKESDDIILFDGICNLCNAAVNFVLDHDQEEKFRFAALQSETGHALLRRFGRDPNDMSSLVLVQ
eukprot:748704-Hanusia_phi.AAC.5